MKLLQLVLFGLMIAITFSACNDGDDEMMTPEPKATFFNWDVGSESIEGAVTAAYDDSVIVAWAESRVDQGIQIRMVATVDGPGLIILNENESDPDDDNLMEYINHGERYITTTTHFIELNITAVNEQNMQMEGTFSGEVVNINDPSDVQTIENGEFVIGYF